MPSPPNVVLVVMDTVRRDRVSCYGHDRPTTPCLDRFAARATRFTDPVSQASWSIPAHASLLTGEYPSEHGATTVSPILRNDSTLPALLGEHGYETYAVSPNEYVRPMTGFGTGFDEFHTLSRVRVPDAVASAAAPWVNGVTSTSWLRRPVERLFNGVNSSKTNTVTGREGYTDDGLLDRVETVLAGASDPHFLYVTLMDAHLPRSPKPAHFDRFVDDELADVPVPADERTHLFSEAGMDGPTTRKMRQLYDADVRTADERLGDLLDLLRAAGTLEDSLVVVAADHGDHLGEFGLVGHQHSVFDSVVSVPLVVRFPDGGPGRTVDGQVELRRVFHTILDEAGVRSYPNRSLAAGTIDPTTYGEFFTPMVDIERLLSSGTVAHDPALLGERLSFIRKPEHKVVRYADDEWLFRLPERDDRPIAVDAPAEMVERVRPPEPPTVG